MNLGVSLLQRRSMNLNYKILLLLALCICNAESADPLGQFCNTVSGSQISANIDRLLAELVSKTTSNMVKTNIKFWPGSM